MKKLILAISLLPTLAYAQPIELTFKVSPAEIDVIAKGLETQPFKDAAPVLQKLRQQFVEQQPKPEVKAPIEPSKPKE